MAFSIYKYSYKTLDTLHTWWLYIHVAAVTEFHLFMNKISHITLKTVNTFIFNIKIIISLNRTIIIWHDWKDNYRAAPI